MAHAHNLLQIIRDITPERAVKHAHDIPLPNDAWREQLDQEVQEVVDGDPDLVKAADVHHKVMVETHRFAAADQARHIGRYFVREEVVDTLRERNNPAGLSALYRAAMADVSLHGLRPNLGESADTPSDDVTEGVVDLDKVLDEPDEVA